MSFIQLMAVISFYYEFFCMLQRMENYLIVREFGRRDSKYLNE